MSSRRTEKSGTEKHTMFTTLGLFGSSQCPAGVECSRFHCSFAHRKASTSTLPASGVKRAAVTASGIEKSAKVARSSVGGSATVPSSTKRTETVRPVAKALVSNSSSYVVSCCFYMVQYRLNW